MPTASLSIPTPTSMSLPMLPAVLHLPKRMHTSFLNVHLSLYPSPYLPEPGLLRLGLFCSRGPSFFEGAKDGWGRIWTSWLVYRMQFDDVMPVTAYL